METIVVAQVSSALLVAIVLAFAPTRSAASTFFAVRVDPAYPGTAEAERLLWRFRCEVAAEGVLGLALSLLLLPRPWGSLIGTLLQLALGGWSQLRARRVVLKHAVAAPPGASPPLDIEPGRERLPGGWALQCVPFLMLLGSGIVLALGWGELPEKYPTHWLASGEPNAWAAKRIVVVYGTLAFAASLVAALGFNAWLMLRFSRRGSASERRTRRLTLNVLLGAELLVAAVFSVISLAPLAGTSARWLMLLLSLGLPPLLLIGVVLLLATHRPEERGGEAQPDAALGAVSPDALFGAVSPDAADTHWKGAGAIYKNPADPALFVPKRFGLGYTLNFGHPAAYGVLLVLVGVPLVGALLLGVALH